MQHRFEGRFRYHSLVKSIGLRDIRYNGEIELVLSVFWVCLSDLLCLLFAAYSGHNRVSESARVSVAPMCNWLAKRPVTERKPG